MLPNDTTTDPNPTGMCMCGCGRLTTVSTFNNGVTGYRKGWHKEYVRGHAHKAHIPDVICETCGKAFRIKPSKVDGRKYCCRECADIGHRGEEGLTAANVERFWSYVDTSGGPDACWPFMGVRTPLGYGRFCIRQKYHHAHRVAAECEYGPIPDGLRCCHHCDNPPCCNPKHLYYGTAKDNTADMIRRGRDLPIRLARPMGERVNTAKLTSAQVVDIRRRWGVAAFDVAAEARKYGVSPTSIWAIIKQVNWKHLPSVDDLLEVA